MTLKLHGTTDEYLKRIARLERFKETEVNGSIAWTIRKEIQTKKLINTTQYLYENDTLAQVDTDKDGFIINYGPDEDGKYYTNKQADQLNMAHAIKQADLEYLKQEYFNGNSHDYRFIQMNYCIFKHVFMWLLDEWSPENEEHDDVFHTLLEKAHQINQIFYHWGWYVFPRILDFYETPDQKIRFLYKCTEINNMEHVWNDLPDHPVKISLGRRPRPIMNLIYRIAAANGTDTDTWKHFHAKMRSKEENEPSFMIRMWKSFKLELIEARTSSLWEDAGKGFELESKIPTAENIKWNIPLHVFMNPPVKFIPYLAKTIWAESGAMPNILFTAMELQCYYCTAKCKTVRVNNLKKNKTHKIKNQ